MRSCFVAPSALLLFVLVGCPDPAGMQPRAEKASAPAAPPKAVVVAPVTAEPFESSQTYSGEVWAVAEASLTVGEAGRVRRVLVAEGARVSQGQLLLELDDGLVRAELGRAQAEKERAQVQQLQAQREASRFAQLSDEQIVSERESQFEQSQARALSAEESGARAAVQVMSQRVERHRIVAPFDGTIAARRVDPGDWLTPGQPALQLVTEERVEVQVRVPPWILQQSGSGTQAVVSKGKHSVAAVVTSQVHALDRQTRTALIRLEAKQSPEWLRPGASVQVSFPTRREDGLTVPLDAVVYGLAGERVIRVVDGKAEAIPVTVLQTAADKALIQSPELTVGDSLVVRGNERIVPGQAVTTQGAISGHGPGGAPSVGSSTPSAEQEDTRGTR